LITNDQQPEMIFSVSDPGHVVDEQSELWSRYLPANRHPGDTESSAATVGDYFIAAARFLKADDFRIITASALDITGRSIQSGSLERIEICLVKHGTFYHPSCVHVVSREGYSFDLALNLAVSPEGKACIDRECDALERLRNRSGDVPAVYGAGAVAIGDDVETAMFAARWFGGYHEFHLTRKNDQQKIVVWDDTDGHGFLTDNEEADLYEKAAFIMTCCYNPLTCEQIQPWHHAAGDFVLHRDSGGLDLKLITVRQYTSFFEEPPEDEETIIDALLIFLINLSIRMRLDREEGIGETLWASDRAVAGTVRGFWKGLDHLCAEKRLDPSIRDSFQAMSLSVADEELKDLATLLIRSYHPQSPDLPVIMGHLDEHIHALGRALEA
jgi:hypothetical protein